jgi:hypothetical protein
MTGHHIAEPADVGYSIPMQVSIVGRVTRLLGLAVLLAGAGGCSSSKSAGPAATTFSLKTPTVTVAAGQERYVCYAKTLDSDLAVDRFDYAVVPFVHHVFFSRTLAPETEGLSECDVLFKTTWIPLFVAGKGSDTLQYPNGAASVLPKGTQLVIQLHLLNTSSTDAAASVGIDMKLTNEANPAPVGLYAFGTQVISLAPNSKGSVSYECTPTQDVVTFTDFAHMHKLGTSLTLEVADGSGAFHTVYSRDPYDFNAQYLDSTPLQIPKGTKTRITCNYNNTTSKMVTFGESTTDEMCFLATFVKGIDAPRGCVQTMVEGDAGTDAGACMATANSVGIGAACTAGGKECAAGLSCSSDLSASSGPMGFCMKVGCASASECGGGATCCAPPQAGGIKLCLPDTCLPAGCM